MENNEILDLDPNLTSKALVNMEKAIEDRPSSLELLSEGLTSFVAKSFDKADKRTWFTEHMQRVLADEYEGMDTNSKLALYNIERQAEIDANYKLLSPTFGAITEIIKNQNQDKSGNNPTVQIVNQSVGNPLDTQIAAGLDPRIASGLNTLFQFEALAKKAAEKEAAKKEAEESEESEN